MGLTEFRSSHVLVTPYFRVLWKNRKLSRKQESDERRGAKERTVRKNPWHYDQ